MLIPGSNNANRIYTVTVSPSPDSVFARMTMSYAIAPTAGGVLAPFSLGLRPQVTGQLVSASNVPIANALVSAEPSATAVSLGNQVAFALTAPDKTYDIELVPPPTEPLVRWSIDNRDVHSSNIVPLIAKLPHAVLTHVSVLGPDGAAAPGVEVRAFAIAYASTCATGSCPLPPRLRGDAVAGLDGSAAVLLPAPQEHRFV
jgi:hypothetical protein